ncbi:MAG: hypothetical protein ACK5IC_10790 [Moheibacter sp.]
MNKNIFLSIITLIISTLSNAQIIITDDIDNTEPTIKESISMMLESNNKNKALILPIIDNNTSITNMQDGMFAYKRDEECFVFFKDGAISTCFVENKADKTVNIITEDPPLINNNTSYSIIPVNSGNGTITLTKKSLVTITVYGSHQYINSAAAGSECAYQQLGLFINGTEEANTKHRSIANATGNIYPSQFTWVGILNPGSHTVTFRHKSNSSLCAPDRANRYTQVSAQVVIKEVY